MGFVWVALIAGLVGAIVWTIVAVARKVSRAQTRSGSPGRHRHTGVSQRVHRHDYRNG